MAIIEINNLTFRYKDKFIYDNFNLNIERGSWVTIAGPNGSGKSTLLKLLSGLEKSNSSIKIYDKVLNKKNLYDIRKNTGYVFDNPDNYFACETVEDELAFSLENMGITPSTIKKKITEISELLRIKDILKENPYELSGGQKQKVTLACALMLEPRIIILDEALLMVDIKEREELFKLLKGINKSKKVTIISFTYDLEESKYSDRLIVLNKGKIVVDGTFPLVFEQELIMRKIGLEVPFSVELSKKLKLYELIPDIKLSLESLVDELWK